MSSQETKKPETKKEKIVNLNEDSKKHEHNDAEFEKLKKRQQSLK